MIVDEAPMVDDSMHEWFSIDNQQSPIIKLT
jgi:hypothetical protein